MDNRNLSGISCSNHFAKGALSSSRAWKSMCASSCLPKNWTISGSRASQNSSFFRFQLNYEINLNIFPSPSEFSIKRLAEAIRCRLSFNHL